MLFVTGAAIAFFFELLLLSKKNKSLADKILEAWLFFLGLHLFYFYLEYSGISHKYPHLIGTGMPLPFVHPPLLYLYTAALTGYLPRWNNRLLLHFLPVLLIYIYLMDFFFIPAKEKIAYVEHLKDNPTLYMKLHVPLMIVWAVVYLVFTLRLFKRHRRNLENNYSYTNGKIDLLWLQVLITGMTAIWAVVTIVTLVKSESDLDVAIYTTVVLFVLAIGFFGVRQGKIFTVSPPEIPDSRGDRDEEPGAARRYSKSGLKEGDALAVQEKLNGLMEKEKLFLEEDLSLPKLSEKLEIHPNYLSQVINERFGKNFYDFVNAYRVEEFKRRVARPEYRRWTFFALATDCGFASKAAFNKAFKKFTGQTPSEFSNTLSHPVT